MPINSKKDLPTTLQRSDEKAQRTWAKAADSAEEQYGDGERSRRVAWSALKHTHEKKGDHWEPKKGGRKGPSDPQASNPRNRSQPQETYGGVDAVGNSKQELYERAKELDVQGRSSMSKSELAKAVARKQ
ncbi:MAG TPA: ChaB family protein [Solirubrobacteraceae bacterium]|nr:ChaB family protein [Solirubrobacteraceae bacterium]